MTREQQLKEIKTIQPRCITLNLSDADCNRVLKLCGEHELTIGKLIENFIGDLICGTYSNGSDECDLARSWFNRCGFLYGKERSLFSWLNWEWISVEDFVELLDDIRLGHEDLDAYEKEPDAFDQEAVEYLKEDIEYWEEQLADCKTRYLRENPKADWEQEVKKVCAWHKEGEVFKECEILR